MREAVSTALFCRWLGGLRHEGESSEPGSLATIQEIGQLYNGIQHPPPLPQPPLTEKKKKKRETKYKS